MTDTLEFGPDPYPLPDFWEDVEQANSALYRTRRPLRDYLFKVRDLELIPPIEWLIEGVLPRDALAVLYGFPGKGKTFVALDWALSLAAPGASWEGRLLADTPRVLYILAEGAGGLPPRVEAWEEHHQQKAGLGLTFLLRAANFLAPGGVAEEGDWEQLRMIVAELHPHLVIVDTMSRAIPGADENDTGTMSGLMDRADQLRELGDSTTVLFVHHTNKGGGYRGSSVIAGQADTMIEVTEDRELRVTKQKDGKEAELGQVELVEVGDTGSVVATYVVTAPNQGDIDEETARRTLILSLIRRDGEKGINKSALFREVGGRKGSFYALLDELIETGHITSEKGPNNSTILRPAGGDGK